eukprot:340633_1
MFRRGIECRMGFSGFNFDDSSDDSDALLMKNKRESKWNKVRKKRKRKISETEDESEQETEEQKKLKSPQNLLKNILIQIVYLEINIRILIKINLLKVVMMQVMKNMDHFIIKQSNN